MSAQGTAAALSSPVLPPQMPMSSCSSPLSSSAAASSSSMKKHSALAWLAQATTTTRTRTTRTRQHDHRREHWIPPSPLAPSPRNTEEQEINFCCGGTNDTHYYHGSDDYDSIHISFLYLSIYLSMWIRLLCASIIYDMVASGLPLCVFGKNRYKSISLMDEYQK